jgi:hypothetical protein
MEMARAPTCLVLDLWGERIQAIIVQYCGRFSLEDFLKAFALT